MAKEQPLVSVVIPVFGVEDYLDRCVESVRRQTYHNLEIILVDDGSPDRCPELCDAFAAADPRILVIHKENGGLGAARNSGIDICTGDFIMFVDSDDFIEPEMVGAMLAAAQEHDADLVASGCRIVRPFATVKMHAFESAVVLDNMSMMQAYLRGIIPALAWAKLYARHLFESLRFPPVRTREDVYVAHELLGAAHTGVFVPEPYYVQYIRAGSLEMLGFDREKLVAVEAGDRLLDYVSERYPTLVDDARYLRALQVASLMALIRSSLRYRANRDVYRTLHCRLTEELRLLSESHTELDISRFRHANADDVVFAARCALSSAKRLLLIAFQRLIPMHWRRRLGIEY